MNLFRIYFLCIIFTTINLGLCKEKFNFKFQRIVSLSELNNDWDILKMLKSQYKDARIVSYFSENETSLCMYEVVHEDNLVIILVASPLVKAKSLSLFVNNNESSEELGVAQVSHYGQLVDGDKIIDEKDRLYDRKLGSSFKLKKSDSCELSINLDVDSANNRSFVAKKNHDESWIISVI